jgi:site-specific DNA recombinase
LNRAQEAARNLEQDARKHVPDLIERIVVHSDRMEIAIRGGFLAGDDQAEAVWLTIPISLKRSGLAMRLIVNNTTQAREPDARLIALLAKGHDWLARLTSGRSNGVGSIAKDEGVTSSYVTRVIYLAFLAPDIVQRITRGEHPADLTAERLIRMVPLPEDWAEQRRLLGMDAEQARGKNSGQITGAPWRPLVVSGG